MTDQFNAKWIWHAQAPVFNSTVLFRHCFSRPKGDAIPQLSVTAESRYRVFLNGQWIADGPARAWPESYLIDRHPLHLGMFGEENVFEVLVTNWGFDNFQHIATPPGLLMVLEQGGKVLCATGEGWEAALAEEYKHRAPRFGCQLGFEEICDSRLSVLDARKFQPATLLTSPEEVPHQILTESTTPRLSRISMPFAPCLQVRPACPHRIVTLPKDLLFKTDPAQPNIQKSEGVWLHEFEVLAPISLRFTTSFGFDSLWIDGVKIEPSREAWVDGMRHFDVHLPVGPHLLALLALSENNINEITLAVHVAKGSPADLTGFAGGEGSWLASARLTPAEALVKACASCDLVEIRSRIALQAVEPLEASPSFRVRCSIPDNGELRRPLASMPFSLTSEDPELLCFDLGQISVGHPSLEVDAPSGTILEGYLVEHIENPNTTREWIHHTANKQNGFRVVCRDGITRWTAKERRGGRYLFLLVSGPAGEVRFHRMEMLESTYPVAVTLPDGEPRFSSSDPGLDRMHRMALRTLQLCMEDTFTDCPTYEQVTWIGDARNEALFNYFSFGVHDIVRRGIELGAQSLECDADGLVRALVPNRIEFTIPAWSFLWGIQVWEYYWYSADREFLAATYPAVRTNLQRALARVRDNGLFEGAGMFDWAPIDSDHPFVTHNQMFLIQALETGALAADALGHGDDAAGYRASAKALRQAVLRHLWLPERGAFADSLHADGSPSPKSCLHNFALGLLYGVVPEGMEPSFIDKLLKPPAGLTEFGSPFAKFYMLEALLSRGLREEAMESLHEYWIRMMPEGATTFWEMVHEEWLRGESPQATRSHCHGWSAAPLYLFGRVLLGVEVLEPGFRRVRIDPLPWRLNRAGGVIPTPHGELRIDWILGADGEPVVDVLAPTGISWRVAQPSESVTTFQDPSTPCSPVLAKADS